MNIWQKGIEIADEIYAITENFPKSELFGLVGQMRRASVSISSNIAEGFVRNHSKEYRQFLYIALGSCAELDTQLILSRRRNYITENKLQDLAKDINHESRMLMSLIKKL
ncbi:MAG: four helix bundle protein [Sedimentisphaerales bacterium]|nr:four helix bundle protein [Sedimentisphaerales bacterium]